MIAAIAGPALAAWSKNIFSTALFAGSYLMVFGLGLVSAMLILVFYRNRDTKLISSADLDALTARPTRAILIQPIFIASAANNIIGAVAMMFVMTAAPLAAVASNYSIDVGASIIQWHLVGMYAPSFVTGLLISRFGILSVLSSGMVLNLMCVAAAVLSNKLVSFQVALFCLGVGWNFMFVGGTTLLARSYRPSERAKIQGIAEFIRFAATAIAALVAGPFLASYGWSTLNVAVVPMIIVAAVTTLWWAVSENSTKTVAAE